MESSDGSGEEDNLENFTTIDSVGDVDGEEGKSINSQYAKLFNLDSFVTF